ncbi:YcgN family cysteine cluster protein [Halopseudomonas sp.]|uniref:YcgN family cysteine cluster protein n=1 Tax=Halopseudomonas sp. TaxID=2901191 RepID=UPI0030016FAC
MAQRVEPFWQRKTLEQMDQAEWESLCDGCGLCCLQKLEDEDDVDAIYYTRVACKLLDRESCQCSNYAERTRFVPDCIQLTPGDAAQFKWLPPTCGYRRVAEGKDLPPWHHLVCGDPEAVHAAGISQAGRMIAEDAVAEDDWEEHIIFRVG